MGLDAYVRCTCFADGLTTPPPVPVEVDDEGYLSPRDDGDRKALWDWEASCCAHPGRKVIRQRISNWSGFRSLQQAFEAVGWAHYPTLQSTLPEGNGGSTSAADSARCLRELADFEARYHVDEPILVDGDTGAFIYDHIAAYRRLILYAGSAGVHMGIDGDGGVVESSDDSHTVLFRAMRVEQRPGADGRTELIDLDTGASWSSPTGLSGHTRLEVRRRVLDAGHHRRVLDALIAVFEASVATGQPVIWC
jgi:hypothetical protein